MKETHDLDQGERILANTNLHNFMYCLRLDFFVFSMLFGQFNETMFICRGFFISFGNVAFMAPAFHLMLFSICYFSRPSLLLNIRRLSSWNVSTFASLFLYLFSLFLDLILEKPPSLLVRILVQFFTFCLPIGKLKLEKREEMILRSCSFRL